MSRFAARRVLVDPKHQRLLKTASLCIAAATAITFMAFIAIWHFDTFGMDFGVYWRVANGPVSQAYEQRSTLNFLYLPTMLLWISPLGLIPKWMAYALWVSISILALIVSCRRHLSNEALLLALIAPPVTFCLLTGQVSVALGALILWACTTDNRIGAGIALGVVASIKPQLVLMSPLFLIANKDGRAIISAGLTFASLASLSIVAFGLRIWASWLDALDHFRSIVVTNGILNVSITPASVADLWHLPVTPFLIAGIATGAWVTLSCRNCDPLRQSAAIVTGSLLAAPFALFYDLAALMPFLAWAVTRGRIVAALAYAGSLNIVPLLVTAFELRHKPDSAHHQR